MCKTGGPRCARHVGIELNKAVAELDKAKKDPNTKAVVYMKLAKTAQEKLDEYDSTPTGQKKLEAEIAKENDLIGKHRLQKRLDKSKVYRYAMEQKGIEARQRIQDFEDLKKQADDELENPTFETRYKNSITSAILSNPRGEIEDENKSGWGGPRPDTAAKEHFQRCGVMASNNVNESYSWETYDTMNVDERVGVKVDVTCHCGKHVNRKAVLENASMGSLLSDMLNNNNGKSY